MKNIVEALEEAEKLLEKAADEEFMDRVAIAVLPELIKENTYLDACVDAYCIANVLLGEKKRRKHA